MPALGSKVVKTLPLKAALSNESLTLNDAVVRLSTTAVGDAGGVAVLVAVLSIHIAVLSVTIQHLLFFVSN